MIRRVSKAVGKWWCAIILSRGGKHRFDGDDRCIRCGRKQPVRKSKAKVLA